MIYYHLYDTGEGPRIEFLCVATTRRDAEIASARQWSDGHVLASMCVLNESEFMALHDSMHQTMAGLTHVSVDARPAPYPK